MEVAVMEHTLVLEIPENMYEPLVKTAQRTGQTLEEVAMEWLANAIQPMLDDPVESFIGAFSSPISDWADQHDKYLGQALMEQNHKQNDEGNNDA
jgi:hypothetical protein